MKVMLVAGGAGFIGSHFTTYFLKRNKNYIIVNIDKLAYGGNLKNLKEIEDSPRHHFIKGDICNSELIDYVMRKYRPDFVVNFAGEASPERSVAHPTACIAANITGAQTLLEAARFIWSRQGMKGKRFIQVSTSDVYGNIPKDDFMLEESPLSPVNPYSASKAAAEMLARAYWYTYSVPSIITRCCNCYGPGQNPDNFISSCIINTLNDKPVYIPGSGTREREWIYITDLCVAIIRAIFYGKPGETYNIGTGSPVTDLELAGKISLLLDRPQDRIHLCHDDPGLGTNCRLNVYKARCNLAWCSKYSLEDGLAETVRWFSENI